jgi:uncharacterized protein (TIGR00730 family)
VTAFKSQPPPHPSKRRQPLPHCTPKPASEDPEAPARIQAILASAAYRIASEDLGFLAGPSARGLRLMMDYQKPEDLLQAEGIKRTIVVFGSSRILEPATARARLEAARAAFAANPADGEAARRLALAERAVEKCRYYEIARAFGRLVAERGMGDGEPVFVMTGGGPGIMEAANRGAFEAGAKTVGLNISLPHEQYPNPYVTPGLCFDFHYFAMRKLHFLERAAALVAFPGGFGTFDELFEVLTLAQTRKIAPIPIVLVGERHWRRAVDFEFLAEEGVIDAEDLELFWYAETAEEIWESIRDWRQARIEAFGAEGAL